MAGEVQFLEEDNRIRRPAQPTQTGIIGFMLRKGWVKTPAQANLYLILLIIVCVVVIMYNFTSIFSGPPSAPNDPNAAAAT
jgi:hypothetical protein